MLNSPGLGAPAERGSSLEETLLGAAGVSEAKTVEESAQSIPVSNREVTSGHETGVRGAGARGR